MNLSTAQTDRACGAVLGSATGDALGAGYEFDLVRPGADGPQMIGGGLFGFAPGEWTDDTSMAWCILDVTQTEADLRTDDALTKIARGFITWARTAKDVGAQTRSVLNQAGTEPTASTMTAISRDYHQANPDRSGGNGSLMRTAAVALPYLASDAEPALVEAARKVSALTHYDPRAQEACLLWSLAIRHAILHGEFDVRSGLRHLDADAAAYWAERLDEAETQPLSSFTKNGWVVVALQAAWAAIMQTPVPKSMPCRHFQDALTAAIGIGHDTDTVAAIAGALLGARWGASAVPAKWRRVLHGYPDGLKGERLVELAFLATRRGRPGAYEWPRSMSLDSYQIFHGYDSLVQHPFDEGVWIGGAKATNDLPAGVTAVVSLCLMPPLDVPEHVTFRLIDKPESVENENLDFVLRDAATTVAALRDEGRQVFLNCVAAQSRTPTVAIAYAMLRGHTYPEAAAAVRRVLPDSKPNEAFAAALSRFGDNDDA